MKKSTILLIMILFMVIGYAAYNTTINIYGLGKLSENISDFKVYLSSLKLNGAEISGINDAKDEFTISDINGDVTVDIVNDSTEYDVEAYLECEKEVEENSVWTYDYKGSEETFIAVKKGTYKLETWGAQGGSSNFKNTDGEFNTKGGYGGYSEGIINLDPATKLYINVGGQGIEATTVNGGNGGYNGGGTGGAGMGYNSAKTYFYTGGGGGGGATHIATSSGILSTLQNNIPSILIVSGGGGGATGLNRSEITLGSHGGGFVGNPGYLETIKSFLVSGGTQSDGYSFGQGASGPTTNNAASWSEGGAGGGGSGFYGGKSALSSENYSSRDGAGGSGYIGNSSLTQKSMYCYNCSESTDESTKTVSTTCANATATENCAKSGDGYARISLLSSFTDVTTDKVTVVAQESTSQNLKSVVGKSLTCKLKLNKLSRTEKKTYPDLTEWSFDYTGEEQVFTTPISGTYKLEVWGAQGGNASNTSTYGGNNGSSAIGGYGGYSSGLITLSKGQKINIVVGSEGTSSGMNEFSVLKGGYNGGGNGGKGNNSFSSLGCYSGAGGGGATHIAFSAGLLVNFKNKLSELLIVAGGGGGAINHNTENNNGGAAGGIAGNGGSFLKTTTCNSNLSKINGGTQTSGYLFGVGQTGRDAVSAICAQSGAAGGGGGFYGGMSQTENYDTSSGGGGSGYIGNTFLSSKAMYCYNCTESTEESTKTIKTTCTSVTPTENCSKQGNGYARITLISAD